MYAHLILVKCLHSIRLTKDCCPKAHWINVAISFGVDLEEIFRLGICSITQNQAGDEDENIYDEEDRDNDDDPKEGILLVKAYEEIIEFIPDLKTILPHRTDSYEGYFYQVVDAVSYTHIPS